ncbi:AraC family transcriptional regulator [Pseudomonas sp. NPDC090202]|uniref:AraC family transcriptional regulator n=1 Tax=unclassified Pseudomonas TaxID=196821 RepID=UPI00381FE12A
MQPQLLSARSQVFQQADPYAVSEYVNQHVGNHCIELPRRGSPQASVNHRKFSNLDLCRLSYGGSVRVTSQALENIYHLQILLAGHCRSEYRGDERIYLPGELLLINPDDPVDLTYSADCEKFIVRLPISLLESSCAEQHWLRPSEGIRFAQTQRDINGILNLLTLVCDEAETVGSLPHVQEHYARILGSKLLSLLSNNVQRVSAQDQGSSFEHLAHFIEERLTQDISITQLINVAMVSERSLYTLFERHVGTSPKDYVRQRKLERIHNLLRDPAYKARSVTEIAMDHGFVHLGRFAECYRQRFGELPSATFKRYRGGDSQLQ